MEAASGTAASAVFPPLQFQWIAPGGKLPDHAIALPDKHGGTLNYNKIQYPLKAETALFPL